MTAQLRVGGTAPITVVVDEGALARYGIANAASNLITIERDNTPPMVRTSREGGRPRQSHVDRGGSDVLWAKRAGAHPAGRQQTAALRGGAAERPSPSSGKYSHAQHGAAALTTPPHPPTSPQSPRPQPVITTPGATAVTYDTQLFFSIAYGEPVLGTNPFELFGWSGTGRLDAVLDVAAGRLDVAAYVVDSSQEADIT